MQKQGPVVVLTPEQELASLLHSMQLAQKALDSFKELFEASNFHIARLRGFVKARREDLDEMCAKGVVYIALYKVKSGLLAKGVETLKKLQFENASMKSNNDKIQRDMPIMKARRHALEKDLARGVVVDFPIGRTRKNA